jgi:hypothetical protein
MGAESKRTNSALKTPRFWFKKWFGTVGPPFGGKLNGLGSADLRLGSN